MPPDDKPTEAPLYNPLRNLDYGSYREVWAYKPHNGPHKPIRTLDDSHIFCGCCFDMVGSRSRGTPNGPRHIMVLTNGTP